MVDIIPFKGLGYNLDSIEEISEVLAPPYDIISETERLKLKESSKYNIVNLTLPEATGGNSGYESAKKLLKNWIENRILTYESEDCFYLFKETFRENNKNKCLVGLVGLLRLEEYGDGKVLRHEKTLPKPKEDRLNLLKACRTNLEFIYTLYNDSDNKVSHILNNYLYKSPPFISTSVKYDPGLNFSLWKISEQKIKDNIVEMMRAKTLLIADGHHRYETSRIYREMSGKPEGSREDYILALFVSSNQEDIIIHPTHRLVSFASKPDTGTFIRKLEKYFEIKIPGSIEINDIQHMMEDSALKSKKSFLICFSDGMKAFITLKKPLDLIYDQLEVDTAGFDEEFEYLDVNILHKLIFDTIFKGHGIKDISYAHTVREILDGLENKTSIYDMGIILNAPTISTVENLSSRNKIMPQKSTYFFPKPCSGLVLYKFDPES